VKWISEIYLPVREHTWLIGSGGRPRGQNRHLLKNPAKNPETLKERWTKVKISVQGDLATGLWEARARCLEALWPATALLRSLPQSLFFTFFHNLYNCRVPCGVLCGCLRGWTPQLWTPQKTLWCGSRSRWGKKTLCLQNSSIKKKNWKNK